MIVMFVLLESCWLFAREIGNYVSVQKKNNSINWKIFLLTSLLSLYRYENRKTIWKIFLKCLFLEMNSSKLSKYYANYDLQHNFRSSAAV